MFISRSYEKSIEKLMLSDKNYVIPKMKVYEYIEEAISIPYREYIEYVRMKKGQIADSQLTQSSSFVACSSDMCTVLESQGNPGLHFIDIGKLFPQYVKVHNDAAFRKYGENQIKTSSQLGLSFEYYGYWYLTCIGYIYNLLEVTEQKSLLARTILRIPLYQHIISEILEEDVEIIKYMQSLSDSTKGRRSGSILRMINICLDECKKEGINYHNLFYPTYNSREKRLVMAIKEGFEMIESNLKIDIPYGEKLNHHNQTDNIQFNPQGSILINIDDDEEVRIFIFNMMALYDGTTIMRIVVECQKEFQQKYYGMKLNDWRHLLLDYIRMKTERPALQEDEIFRYIAV